MNSLKPQFGSLASYLISLPDCGKRRDTLILNGLAAEFVEGYFEATDLRNIRNEKVVNDFVDPSFKDHYDFTMSNGQIGCAISHREVARSFLTVENDLALILEDDVVPASPSFAARVENLATVFQGHARAGASFIVHLGVAPHWHKRVLHRRVSTDSFSHEFPPLFLHVDPAIGFWYTHAYILSKEAAVRIVEREEKLISNVDDWLYRRQIGLIDQVFYTQPLIFTQNDTLESSIEADRQGRTSNTSNSEKNLKQAQFNKSRHKLVKALSRRVSYSFHKMRSVVPYRLTVK